MAAARDVRVVVTRPETQAEPLSERLEALGHRVVQNDLNSGLHAIAIDYTRRGRVLLGGVDPRREGVAVGD